MEYNVYCDESGHLERDQQNVMVPGAVWCPRSKVREILVRTREIKTAHGLPMAFEIKWTKVFPAKIDFYLAILDYFFDDDLHFRALVGPTCFRLLILHGGSAMADTRYRKWPIQPTLVGMLCFGVTSLTPNHTSMRME